MKTDRDVVSDVDSIGLKTLCITYGPDPREEGHFWREWRRDFPARRRTPDGPNVGISPHAANQCSYWLAAEAVECHITVNFPDDKYSVCDAACRQNSWTTYYYRTHTGFMASLHMNLGRPVAHWILRGCWLKFLYDRIPFLIPSWTIICRTLSFIVDY